MRAIVVSHAMPQRRTPVRVHHLKQAIKHASNLCINFEDTTECKLAWERVDEISDEMDRQREEEIIRRLEESKLSGQVHPESTSSTG